MLVTIVFHRKVKSHTQCLLDLIQDVPRCRPVGASIRGCDKLGERVLVDALNVAIVGGVAVDDGGDAHGSAFLIANHRLADQVIAISFGLQILLQDDGGRDCVVASQVLRRVQL